ncbi:MAG TPA: MauE/DoxX family redox-associated membrane protein [Candidatus Tumulicola sp.]|jgi:uncharacterized membrane protein YphA (DoxX/SURF4 family)
MGTTKGVTDLAVFAVRLVVGGLLVLAAVLKIGHSAELAASIAGFRLLPAVVVGPLALALPYFELALGGYLVVGLFVRVAAIVACGQFVLYAIAIASAVIRHIPASCGCFGPNDAAVADWPHVAFDLALASAGAFVAAGAPGVFALDRRLRPR